MVRVLVTGVAGFIGSHAAERLLRDGHAVLGIDAITSTYAPELKLRNVERLLGYDAFQLTKGDLQTLDLRRCLDGVEAVLHLAGEPGVRQSWGAAFPTYLQRNVEATQRLLEAVHDRGHGGPRRFVLASSSAVYGNAPQTPTDEEQTCAPVSPYGVTKLAAEQLARAYAVETALPLVTLRFFTVYGPRQRPDMALARFISSWRAGRPVTVYGDGMQTRDLTYVDDVVDALVAALRQECVGGVFNVGGGHPVSLLELLEALGEVMGGPGAVEFAPAQPGDVAHTHADGSRARRVLGYIPQTPLHIGLARQVAAP